MDTVQTVTLCLVAMTTLAQMVRCWDQADRDYILDLHNEIRRRPNACEMNKIEYDMDLENQAKGWAHNCQFRHEMKQGRGENLAWNTAKSSEHELIDIAAASWYDEIKMYSYGQYSCSMSCHYTQLVWAKTTKVGCYTYRCPNLMYAAANAWYLVCFYTPMGNWSGEKPYKTSCPAKCLAGQTEDNGLCSGQATGGGSGGSGDCKDTRSACVKWAARGQCQRNPGYMLKKCAKSCKAC